MVAASSTKPEVKHTFGSCLVIEPGPYRARLQFWCFCKNSLDSAVQREARACLDHTMNDPSFLPDSCSKLSLLSGGHTTSFGIRIPEHRVRGLGESFSAAHRWYSDSALHRVHRIEEHRTPEGSLGSQCISGRPSQSAAQAAASRAATPQRQRSASALASSPCAGSQAGR